MWRIDEACTLVKERTKNRSRYSKWSKTLLIHPSRVTTKNPFVSTLSATSFMEARVIAARRQKDILWHAHDDASHAGSTNLDRARTFRHRTPYSPRIYPVSKENPPSQLDSATRGERANVRAQQKQAHQACACASSCSASASGSSSIRSCTVELWAPDAALASRLRFADSFSLSHFSRNLLIIAF